VHANRYVTDQQLRCENIGGGRSCSSNKKALEEETQRRDDDVVVSRVSVRAATSQVFFRALYLP
jgi:hypothetical protein